MSSRNLGIGLVLLALVAAPLVAAPSAPETRTTVGKFATDLVVALGREAHDMDAVRAAFKSLGAPSTFDPSATLTDGMASRMASDLGIVVAAPRNPEAAVSPARASALVASISSMHVEKSGISADEGPTQCLSSENRGACVNCCKEASGLGGQFCGHYCHANVPPPVSPEEPVP